MTLPLAFLDELRTRLPLASVIGRRVKLEKKGREHHGLCPFHTEKSPSFTVNEDKGFFHCFGCGAHGDVIEFEARVSGLSFLDAVERLAAEAGMEIPRATPEERQRDAVRAGLHQALEAACAWFEAQLHAPGGAAARGYLHGRGLSDETIARFRLGWAPAGGAALLRGLDGRRYPEALLIEAGLARRGEDGGVRDLFRGRVTFPITDRRGRVIAFGGRLLGDGQPKYLNSPETPLFDKGGVVFGLSQAREQAGKVGRVVVVEGYLDVIALHQAGLPLAVAPLGTAFTERQMEALWRIAPEIVVAFDGDAAGQAASERAVDRALPLLTAARAVRVARLPAGMDPDELVKARGIEGIKRVIGGAISAADEVWWGEHRGAHADTPERLAALEARLWHRAAQIADPVTRRAVLDRWRERMRRRYRAAGPVLLVGRSRRVTAPRAGAPWLREVWQAALEAAAGSKVSGWLRQQGIDPEAVARRIGGVGLVRGKIVTGKPAGGQDWPGAPRPRLWSPAPDDAAAPSLLLLPVWAVGPDDPAPLDLVAWDPRRAAPAPLATLTGHAALLGEGVAVEAMALEADGLVKPVAVVGSPLAWLADIASGRDSVMVIDWGRAWEALGPLSTLVAETIELGEALDRHVRPSIRRPRIQVVAAAVTGDAA